MAKRTMKKVPIRVIISGGGTGGHIFPAISIAGAIKAKYPDSDILFVGAAGRMEMHRVPAAGYQIIGLPIQGFDRKNLFKNISVLFKVLKSQWIARRIIKEFEPHVAVGVGGYASGPLLKMAGMMGIPTLLQEQNSYAGVTNKLLAKKACKICVAYEGMERFFEKDKILLTGNPIRQGLLDCNITHEEAVLSFGLNPQKPTVLIIGGSLGARTLNECILKNWNLMLSSGVQFIWQTGKTYYPEIKRFLKTLNKKPEMLYVSEFISKMEYAYMAADLVISRAGAGSISEFCVLRKPVILVPSPNVAEDHQTKNALALVEKNAALYVKDSEAVSDLLPLAIETVNNEERLNQLSENIATMAYVNAAEVIATEVYNLAVEYKKAKEK